MTRYKLVNGERLPFTAEEEAEHDAFIDADDQNVEPLRRQRNRLLERCDRVMLSDWPLGSQTIEDWQTYRQDLRDYMATTTRQSTAAAWPKSPAIIAAGQAAYDAEVAKEGSGPVKGEAARTAAEFEAGYPEPGI